MFGNQFGRPNLKRGHSPDHEVEQRGPQFRQQHGQGFVKRHRPDNYNLPQTIEERIIRLGDTGFRNADIGVLAKDIDTDLLNKQGEEDRIKVIVTTICKCIISFPTRVSTYATLIGLISVKHYNVSCQIISSLHASYPLYLESQKWREALCIIHSLSCLVNCKVIQPSALISQFNHLLDVAQEEGTSQARSDYFIYTILSSMPYVALELSIQEDTSGFERLLSSIETLLSKRSKQHLTVTRVWFSNDSTLQMDYLDSLWIQMKNFRANGWNESFLHRPYNEKEYKDIMASSLIPQNSPAIQVPAYSENHCYPYPRIVLRIFEDDVSEHQSLGPYPGPRHIPGSDKIERFCVENQIRNMIDEIPNTPLDCVRHLTHFYKSDQLPMKYILIETLLGELFTLPKPRHDVVLYQSLIYELSKIYQNPNTRGQEDSKTSFENILNSAAQVLYQNLETMNVTCLDRFVNWFSYHLNVVNFVFPWQCWSDATCKDIDSPKTIFVQSILDHCIRFSFHKKILTITQEQLSNLIPPEAKAEFRLTYADDQSVQDMANMIRHLITTKADMPTIGEKLNVQIPGINMPEGFELKDEKPRDRLSKIDAFTAVLLDLSASKSLTHLSSAMGNYLRVFKALLTGTPGGQVQLLQTMYLCFDSHPQLQVILVEKLVKAQLIDVREVCNWIFSESMRPNHLRPHLWDILSSSFRRFTLMIDKKIGEKKALESSSQEDKPTETDGSGDVEMKKEDSSANNNATLIEAIDVKVKQLQGSLDALYLDVFRMFADTLKDHIRKCEENGTSYMDNYFRWATGRMQQFYFEHYDVLQWKYSQIKVIVETTPSIGNSIFNLRE